MKLEDAIKLLFLRLPFQTDLFTDVESGSVVNYDNVTSTLTVQTAVPHMLKTGSLVSITNAIEPIPITQIIYKPESCSAVATCATNHDLTLNGASPRYFAGTTPRGFYKPCIYPEDRLVDILGANESEYNGSKVLLNIIDNVTFEYLIIGDQPATSPATGTMILNKKENLFNNLFPVDVIDGNIFDISVIDNLEESPVPVYDPLDGFKVHMRHRISGGISPDRLVESYTEQEQNKLWLFCTLEGSSGSSTQASQRRQIKSDAIDVSHRGNQYLQNLIENLSVLVFSQSVSTISAREQRDLIQEVKKYLFRSLLGVVLPSEFYQIPFGALVFNSDRVFEYNTGYYIHEFNFERLVNIQQFDIAEPLFPISLNQIDINYLKEDTLKDEVIMTDKIKPGE